MSTSKQESQERGEARIQELREQFPKISREIVIKADYIIKGIRNTPVMKEVGRWAIPDSHDLYEYDREEHFKDDMAGAYTQTPISFHFRNGAAFKVMFDSTSPYEVKYEGRGSYWLYRDGEPLEEVHFPPCPQWYRKRTSSGKPMASILGLRGEQSLGLITTNRCEYFRGGHECQYCNMDPGAEHLMEAGLEKTLGKREQDIYESYMAAAQEMKVVTSFTLGGGSFIDRRKEADLWIRMAGVMVRAMKDSGVSVPLMVGMQAMEKADYQRCKDAGGSYTVASLDVWDRKIFEWLAPGKAENVGWEHYIECVLGAVEVFGRGQVVCHFVLGVEMLPPYGFKTEDEAAASVLEGVRFMASRGVDPALHILRTVPGAKLSQAPRPRTEYVLRTEQAFHEIMKEHNLLPEAKAGANLPIQHGFRVGWDWLDVPQEAIWPPALRK